MEQTRVGIPSTFVSSLKRFVVINELKLLLFISIKMHNFEHSENANTEDL